MSWLLRFSVRRPWAVVVVSLVLTAAAVSFIPRVELRLNGRALIPEGHPSMREADEAARLFGLRDVVMMAVAGRQDGIYDPAALQLLARLSSDLADTEGIVPWTVMSLATVPRLYIESDTLDATPLLDPATAPGEELVQRIHRETEAMGLADGVLVARDGRAAAIYAEVAPEADRYRIHRRVQELARRRDHAATPVYFSGTALAQAVLGEAAAQDLVRLVPLVVLVVGGVMFFAFRRLAPVVASLAEVGVSLAWTIGLIGLLGKAVFITTLALPVILVVIGVSDDVYALARYFREARSAPERPVGEVVVAAFEAVKRPILLTSVTTVVGLLSLAATHLEPQRVFGLFGAVSVLFSTLLTFTLVPAVLVLLKPRALGQPRRDRVFGEGTTRAILRALQAVGPRRAVVATALLALVAILVSARLRVEDNWVRNLPPDSDTYRGDRAINARLAGTNTLELMLDVGRPEALLEPTLFNALGRLERRLDENPHVGAVESVYGDVVRVDAALQGRAYARFRREMEEGGTALTRPEIEQSLMLLASSGHAPMVERLDSRYQRTRITVFIRSANFSRVAAVLETAAEAVAELFPPETVLTPFGDGWISYLTVRLLVAGQVRSIGLAVLSDTVLLVALFGALATALLAIAPVAVSVLLVFAAIAVTGTPLGTANSMFAAIALGVGVDYSIHLVESWRGRQAGGDGREAMTAAVLETGPAILTSALAIAVGFSVLLFSQVLPNRQLGWAVCLTMTACAVMTLVLVPSLVLLRIERRESRRHRRSRARVAAGRRAVLLLLGATALAAPTASAGAAEPTPEEVVARYNGRDFGSPGWRRIFLELKDGETVTRTFTISHLWRQQAGEVHSLVVLEDPVGLRGTSYLLLERGARVGGMDLFLHLPAGRGRVLEIRPSRFDEGLLGSDFSYSDLRWRIPTDGNRLLSAARTNLDGSAAWAVEVQPVAAAGERASIWDRVRYYLSGDLQLLLGADFYGGPRAGTLGPDRPAKQLRVQGAKELDGVWTPTRMVMRVDARRSSVLTLLGETFHLEGYDPVLFTPDHLPAVSQELLAGELVAGVGDRDP